MMMADLEVPLNNAKRSKMFYKYSYWRPVICYCFSSYFCSFCCFCIVLALVVLSQNRESISKQSSENARSYDVRNASLKGGHPLTELRYDESKSDHDGDVYDIVSDEVHDEDDEYGGFPENDVFSEGDFDYGSLNATGSGAKEKNIGTENYQQMFRIRLLNTLHKHSQGNSHFLKHFSRGLKLRNVSMVNFEGIPVVEDKIFWSKDLEDIAPHGPSSSDVSATQRRLRELRVVKAQPPTWNLCGRPSNVFIVFEDGSKACARYRAPHQYLVQGEVLSFYLSRLLSISNVPAVSLVSSDLEEARWLGRGVQRTIKKSGWLANTTVAFIQWIDDLERDKMPGLLLSNLMNGSTINAHTSKLYDMAADELVELLQWSDLVLFDYLTGNYDRVASMQDAADKENRTSILNETIHNLVKSRSTKSLWMIDNESGLLDSYSLLYGRLGQDGRFRNFHRQMLRSICLFRRSTVEQIQWLHRSGKPGSILLEFVKRSEPLLSTIDEETTLSERLQERIAEVHDHIQLCSSSR